MQTLKNVKKLAEGYAVVPIYEEMMADVKTPIKVMNLLKKSRHCFLLESVKKQKRWGDIHLLDLNLFDKVVAFNNLPQNMIKKKFQNVFQQENSNRK